jgi:hypothetical protein
LEHVPSADKFGFNNLYDSVAELSIIYKWLKNNLMNINISDVYRFIENVIESNSYMKMRETCYFNEKEYNKYMAALKDSSTIVSKKGDNKTVSKNIETYINF